MTEARSSAPIEGMVATRRPQLDDWRPGIVARVAALRSREVVIVVARTGWPEARALVDATDFPSHERERAARFRLSRDRDQFLLARAIVRTIAGHRLGRPPREIVFEAPEHRKPRLRALPDIDVSIAHCAEWVACGFAKDARVGIDVEEDDGRRDVEMLIPRVLAANEHSAARGIAARRRAVFFAAWRRKEAVLKAAGLGLAGDPASIDTMTAEGAFAEHVDFAGRVWTLEAVGAPDRPVVAIATSPREDPR